MMDDLTPPHWGAPDPMTELARRCEDADTYPKPEHGWTCFHCGETFKTIGGARDHFGFEPSSDPACRIKLGAERGLVMALRKAEMEIADMRQDFANENTEAAKQHYSQASRHQHQLTAAEEAGYERGLSDGRAAALRAGGENG
jgi:hypothetical protein